MEIKYIKKDSKKSLSFLAGINRPVNPAHVTKLATSLNKMGTIRPIVIAEISFITGKKVDYIIDGQHLYTALIRNHADIPYMYIKIKDEKDLVETIALLNASSKSWTLNDYILAWSFLETDYKKLNRYYEIYDLELTILCSILSSISVTGGGTSSRRLKLGQFKIVNEEASIKILDCLTDVLKIVPRMNRFENRYLCSEYVKFLNTSQKYNHSAFLKKLETAKEKLLLVTHEEGGLQELFQTLA